MQLQPLYDAIGEAQLLLFYGTWQMSVCLFAFFALMAIWYHIGRRQGDRGQVWLALSVLCWSITGGIEIYYATQLTTTYQELIGALNSELTALPIVEQFNFRLEGWRSVLSLLNSLFILLALPWFRYIPKQLAAIISSKYWSYIVGLPFLFSLLPTLSKIFFVQQLSIVSELDVYYSILTLGFLGYVLWESFAKRRLLALAWLSVVCVLITFAAQVYKLTGSTINMNLFSAIFKTSLIMIFFALALSWVKELAENILPDPQQLFLQLTRQKNTADKWEQLVLLQGLPGKEKRVIALSPASFDLFYKFAERRVKGGEDWLEIKPKNAIRPSHAYDIRDHNEIKRLLQNFLDDIFGSGNWTRNQHLQPLKETLFELSEKRERKIRLRIPAENIKLDVITP